MTVLTSGGGGNGGPPAKKPKVPVTLAPEILKICQQLDRAQGFFIMTKRGNEALPIFEEDLEPMEAFGLPAELRMVGNQVVPVLDKLGWHLLPVDC